MDNVRQQILKAAIQKYGPGAQRDKAIEELRELIRALARCDDKENVAEEMADVRIMLDQLEIIFGNGPKVARYEVMKLRRLDARVHAADVIGEEARTDGEKAKAAPGGRGVGHRKGDRRAAGREGPANL